MPRAGATPPTGWGYPATGWGYPPPPAASPRVPLPLLVPWPLGATNPQGAWAGLTNVRNKRATETHQQLFAQGTSTKSLSKRV